MPEVEEMLVPATTAQPSRLEQIINPLLHHAHILYPYRQSRENCRPQSFVGKIYPQGYSIARSGVDPCVMQTECLAHLGATAPLLNISVRFLQLMSREVGALKRHPVKERAGEALFQVIPELRVGGRLFQTRFEALDREIRPDPIACDSCASARLTFPFSFPEWKIAELLCDKTGRVVGQLCRRQESINGEVEVSVALLGCDICKITVRILNQTPLSPETMRDQGAVLMRTFASTQTILHVEGAEFVSLTEPTLEWRLMAAECENIGTWPVFAATEEGENHQVLVSAPFVMPELSQSGPTNGVDKAIHEEALSCATEGTR